jgi:transposase
VKAHTRKKHSGSVRDIIPKDIPVEEVVHELPEDQRQCPQCGETMVVIGTEVHESLKFRPAEAVLQRDIYYTYACKNCEKNDISTPVVKTPKEPTVIPGSFASPEAVAYLATQKFVMGSPLYRQEQEWNRKGLMLSRQTMSNWLLQCSEAWLEPVYHALKAQLVQHDLLHADETEIQVLHESGKRAQAKSYMWLYRTSGDAEHPIVLYEYQPSRSGENPKTFLNGFRGYLQTDGYPGYNALADVVHVGCWAHARRKFEEALKALPKGKRSPTAEQGVAYCTKLFELEKAYEGLTFEKRKQQRLDRSKPVLDVILTDCEPSAAGHIRRGGAA